MLLAHPPEGGWAADGRALTCGLRRRPVSALLSFPYGANATCRVWSVWFFCCWGGFFSAFPPSPPRLRRAFRLRPRRLSRRCPALFFFFFFSFLTKIPTIGRAHV